MSWWVARAERTLTQEVPAPPEEVRDFYVDLDNIKLVHPLIVSVEALSRSETPDGYLQSYRVVDRIPLGPFTMKITYRARLHVPADGDVMTEADQSPGVHLRGTVSFEPIDAGTLVTERIRIAAPRPLAPMTTREAVKAHITMLAGIRRHFESERMGFGRIPGTPLRVFACLLLNPAGSQLSLLRSRGGAATYRHQLWRRTTGWSGRANGQR